MVRELLDRETESAKKGRGSEISRANYDFVFLRQENLSVVPEYVLRIIPKRKVKYLLRGQIWVDASTFRIRRIEGVPARSPSFWIKDIHITLQYAELIGMWIPVSFDAIATVRLAGEYSLAGLNIPPAFYSRSHDCCPGRIADSGYGSPFCPVMDAKAHIDVCLFRYRASAEGSISLAEQLS